MIKLSKDEQDCASVRMDMIKGRPASISVIFDLFAKVGPPPPFLADAFKIRSLQRELAWSP